MRADVYVLSKPNVRFSGVVDNVGFGVTPDPDVIGTLQPGLPDVQRTLNWVHLASCYPVRVRVRIPRLNCFESANQPWSRFEGVEGGHPHPALVAVVPGVALALAIPQRGTCYLSRTNRNSRTYDHCGDSRHDHLHDFPHSLWVSRCNLRLTQDQLIRQVIQGGGNMPAYGKNLSPAETTALVGFLETLHPATQAPARDASRPIALSAGEIATGH